MLLGRLLDSSGRTVGEIAADGKNKAYYKRLSDERRVACLNPACDARLIHVSAVSEDNLSGKFVAEAISVNGEKPSRVPHWRSASLDDHIPGCDYKDDPYFHEHDQTFRQAISAGRPIRISIAFEVGFEGLRNQFTAAAQGGSNGLWGTAQWDQEFPDALKVAARDVGVILHYMEVAKELRGTEGLKQLYFAREGSVQSCSRFVVRDVPERVEKIVGALYDRGMKLKYKNPQFITDTPRLFLFEASEAQQQKAIDTKSSELWGRKFFLKTPLPYGVKEGLGLKRGLTNQIVLDRKGARLWVVGTPEISYNQFRVLMRKANNLPLIPGDRALEANWDKPLFLKIRVDRRSAMIMAPLPETPASQPAAPIQPELPRRQYDLFEEPQASLRAGKTAARKPAATRGRAAAAHAYRPAGYKITG